MNKHDKIYIAGHKGLVGSALVRNLKKQGFKNLILKTHSELDLTQEEAVRLFFHDEKPDYVFLAAAKVGGIKANNTYPAEFIRDNLAIQSNVIHQAYLNNVNRLLFLGSSCIYPKLSPQPMKEEYLLTGALEETNRPYALAKIAGIEMCWAYNRQYSTQFLSAMPTNLYGPGDNYDLSNSHVLPALLRKIHLAKLASEGDIAGIVKDEEKYGSLSKEYKDALTKSAESKSLLDINVWGTGKPKREFMHSDDMAQACIFLMNLPDNKFEPLLAKERNSGLAPIVNIGTGEDISIAELVPLLKAIVGYDGKIVFDEGMLEGTPQKLLNIESLLNLGWNLKTDFKSRLAMVYQDYTK
jgi:GDP-L-fucose synthase